MVEFPLEIFCLNAVVTPIFCLWGFCDYRATCYRRDSSANFCSIKLHYRGSFTPLFLESFKLVAILVIEFLSTFFCSYSSKTVEAERISVDHVAHLKPSDGGSAATQCERSCASLFISI